ncbi:hypothetical protein [Rhodococcus sp. BH4]|uniref:hypothetical protein n=1 Tax=Rhodococcus sp. BH4 TaxID=1807790 RepID=UPI003FA69E60
MSAFFIGGALGTLVGWRLVFGIVLALAVVVFALSFTLRSDRGQAGIKTASRQLSSASPCSL